MFSPQQATLRANLALWTRCSRHRAISSTSLWYNASSSSSTSQIFKGKSKDLLVESERINERSEYAASTACHDHTSSNLSLTSRPRQQGNGELVTKQNQEDCIPEAPPCSNTQLLTLIPEKFQELQQPITDLSNIERLRFDIPLIKQQLTARNHDRHTNQPHFDMRYHLNRKKKSVNFPEGTRGFLYYHQTGMRTPLAGEIRFRICDSPETFFSPESRDLIHHTQDKPWSLPLAYLSQAGGCANLFELLIFEGLVPREIATVFKESSVYPVNHNTVFIYDLLEPFEYKIGSSRYVVLVTPEGLISVRVSPGAFVQKVPMNKKKEKIITVKPFSGSALVRFVPAPMDRFPNLYVEWVNIPEPMQYGKFLGRHNLKFPRVGHSIASKYRGKEFRYATELFVGESQMREIARRWSLMFVV